MMTAKLEDTQVSTLVSSKIHSLLKQQAAKQSTPLRFYIEAGMISVLTKSGSEVKKVIEDFKGDAN